jgi:CcmD family protein
MIKKISLLLFLLIGYVANAQEPQMADGLRSEGKFYVVVTVMAIIFGCVAFYLFRLDMKVKKLEEELKNKK